MRLLRKTIGLWKLAEVYLWSVSATATEATGDSRAPQAHVSFESSDGVREGIVS